MLPMLEKTVLCFLLFRLIFLCFCLSLTYCLWAPVLHRFNLQNCWFSIYRLWRILSTTRWDREQVYGVRLNMAEIKLWLRVVGSGAHQPAVNHHGPSVGQGLGLDSPNEPQQARGVIGHAVVRPAGEVKLSDLPDLMSSSLTKRVIMLNTQSATEDNGGCGE